MGMTKDKLIGRAVADIDDVEVALLLADAGIEANVQQNVAQFLTDFVFIVLYEGISQLEGLLDCVRTQTLVGLLSVPRTILPERVQNIEIAPESRHFFFFCVHVRIFNTAKVQIFPEIFVILHRFLMISNKKA